MQATLAICTILDKPYIEVDAAHLLKRSQRCGDFEVEEAEAGEPRTGEHLRGIGLFYLLLEPPLFVLQSLLNGKYSFQLCVGT